MKFLYIYSRKCTKYFHGTWSLLSILMIFDIQEKCMPIILTLTMYFWLLLQIHTRYLRLVVWSHIRNPELTFIKSRQIIWYIRHLIYYYGIIFHCLVNEGQIRTKTMKDYAIIINHVRKTSITSVIQIFSAHYLWYLITSSSKDPHTIQGRPHQPNRSTNYQLVSWSISVWPLACLWGSLSPKRSRPDQNAVISRHTCSEHYTGHDVWARGEDSISDTERLYNCLTGFCLRCEISPEGKWRTIET